MGERVKDLTGALSKVVVRCWGDSRPGGNTFPSLVRVFFRSTQPPLPLLQVSTARTVTTTVQTVQRKIQPAEASGEGGEDGEAAEAQQEREEAVDSLGFVLQLTAAEAEARARCDASQDRQRAKWEALMAGGDALPPEDKLKRLCRKVLPESVMERLDNYLPVASHACSESCWLTPLGPPSPPACRACPRSCGGGCGCRRRARTRGGARRTPATTPPCWRWACTSRRLCTRSSSTSPAPSPTTPGCRGRRGRRRCAACSSPWRATSQTWGGWSGPGVT